MNDEEREKAGELANILCDAFPWKGTPQGARYWRRVWNNLMNLAEEEKRP
jgi:hypothetical protein